LEYHPLFNGPSGKFLWYLTGYGRESNMDLILANFLENLTPEQYSYKIDADHEVQPGESFTSYLGDLS
jgi:hypothetical protein